NSYSLHNAGLIYNSGAGNIKYNIEKSNDSSDKQDYTILPNNLVFKYDAPTISHNFSKVDGNDLVTNGTYRKYSSDIKSNGLNGQRFDGICDLVGNCTKPTPVYRVVANVLNFDNSKVQIGPGDKTNDRILANASDNYNLNFWLKDEFNNKIVPVFSHENGLLQNQVKKVDSKLDFINGLHEDQTTFSGDKKAKVTNLETDDSFDPSALNAVGSTITFYENNLGATNSVGSNNRTCNSDGTITEIGTKGPNGCYRTKYASAVPTVGSYPYLYTGAIFEVSNLNIKASKDISQAGTYGTLGSFDQNALNGTTNIVKGPTDKFITPKEDSAGTIGFLEYSTDRVTSIQDNTTYGKYTFNKQGIVNFSDLNYKYNFEFASPLVYGYKNFNSLNLSQRSSFKGILENLSTNNITNFNVIEKNLVSYEDPYNKDKETQGEINFLNKTDNINEGVFHGKNPLIANTFGSNPISGIINTIGSRIEFPLEISMEPKSGIVYDKTKLSIGLASSIVYNTDLGTIKIPSVGRGICLEGASTKTNEYPMSYKYFTNGYSLCEKLVNPNPTAGNGNRTYGMDEIAITGLSNKYINLTTETQNLDANVNIGGEILRYDLLSTIKKNIKEVESGFLASQLNNNKSWCSNSSSIITIEGDNLNNGSIPLDKCTINNNGESITFIKGNAKIACGTGGPYDVCKVSNKRTIIVKDGALYIGSNITTQGTNGGQLMLGVIKEGGLSNVTINETTPEPWNADKQGWLYIDPDITNIDAFMFAQGPAISYDIDTAAGYNTPSKVFYINSNTKDTALTNQLQIYGSLISLNTIGKSKGTVPECPYIIENCTANTAQMFDLTFLRRFKFASGDTYLLDTNDLIPYYPTRISGSETMTRYAGGCTGKYIAGCGTSNNLMPVKDKYKFFPLIVERNPIWSTSPSILLKAN
ncbi:MAG: hypothetical protein PHO80_01140, partial [Candidatus Gracilibacteria bacterium]|nr:hypothetical protein [Candidatus Gracilibacteria bacterium]